MRRAFSIRPGIRSDAKNFINLILAFAKFEALEPPDSTARGRIIKDVFEKGRAHLFVAVAEKRLIGYALYFFTYSSFLGRPTLYLEDLFVLEEDRGMGVGTALFMRCVEEAKKRRCGRMEWSVLNWNKKAIDFYEKMGAKKLDWSLYRLDSDSLRSLSSNAA